MRKCPHCGSIWVCWNWVKATVPLALSSYSWVHECWDCENAIATPDKVKDGMWYWFLKMFFKEKKIK